MSGRKNRDETAKLVEQGHPEREREIETRRESRLGDHESRGMAGREQRGMAAVHRNRFADLRVAEGLIAQQAHELVARVDAAE